MCTVWLRDSTSTFSIFGVAGFYSENGFGFHSEGVVSFRNEGVWFFLALM